MDQFCQGLVQPKEFIQTYKVMMCSIAYTKMRLKIEKVSLQS